MIFTLPPSVIFFLMCIPVGVLLYQMFLKKTKEAKVEATAQLTARSYVAALLEQSDEMTYKWLRFAGWLVLPFSALSGIAAILISYGLHGFSYWRNVRDSHMPDVWFDQVLNDSSEEGKAFVSKHLKKHGFVTVNQAKNWLKIEKEQDLAHARATMTGAKAELLKK